MSTRRLGSFAHSTPRRGVEELSILSTAVHVERSMLRKPLEVELSILSTAVEVERRMLRKTVVVGMRNVWKWDGES